MELKSLQTFIDISSKKPKKTLAVAAAEDEQVLEAVVNAASTGIVIPLLVGNKNKIIKIADSLKLDLSGLEFIDEENPIKACKISVKLVHDKQAHILMKGLVGTADFLKAVMDKEIGLRTENLLSHIGFFETASYHKLIALTDAAQNIAPTLEDKISILNNAIDLYHRLGIENPKVAVIAAVETVNPKMPATLDAALLTIMNKRNQIKSCIIDGPLAFDNAVSKEAALHKGIESVVSGDADLLLAPNIEVANALYKCLTYFANAVVAAIILGAAVPVVLTSRADSEKSKLMSIALAASF